MQVHCKVTTQHFTRLPWQFPMSTIYIPGRRETLWERSVSLRTQHGDLARSWTWSTPSWVWCSDHLATGSLWTRHAWNVRKREKMFFSQTVPVLLGLIYVSSVCTHFCHTCELQCSTKIEKEACLSEATHKHSYVEWNLKLIIQISISLSASIIILLS